MAKKNTNFIKIRTSLYKGLEHVHSPDGKIKFGNSFMQRLHDTEEEFRSKLIVEINDKVGLHNWAIQFIEHPTEEPKFFADIWVDNTDHYPLIIGIIRSIIPEIEFMYYYKGNIDSYIPTER